MMTDFRSHARKAQMILIVVALGVGSWVAAGEQVLTFEELMKFRQIHGAVVAADGSWVAYGLVPDRGDGEVVVRSTTTAAEYRVERGAEPVISTDGRWVVSAITPTLEEREKAQSKKKAKDDDKPHKGLSILDLGSGAEERIEEVEAFSLSEDGRWLAYKLYEGKEGPSGDVRAEKEEPGPEEAPEGESAEKETKEKKEKLGTTLKLRRLGGGDEIALEHVSAFAFAEQAPMLAFAVSAPEGEGNRVVLRDLKNDEAPATVLHLIENGRFTELTWARDAGCLAFMAAVLDEDGEPVDAEVWVWAGGDARRAVSREDAPEGFTVPLKNELTWSRDGARLFFGFKPADGAAADDPEEGEEDNALPFDPYDLEAVLEATEVDVWHWNDPRIIPNQKERWKEHEKDRVFLAVVHLKDGKVVPLADAEMPEIVPSDNPKVVLGASDVPYLKEATWDGNYGDLFVVDLATGDRTLVARRLADGRRSGASMSPDGASVLFYDGGDWHLYDVQESATRNLTAGLGVPFANEDHDYPSDPPGYGHSEWLDDSSAVLIYDKYDVWQVFTDGRKPISITGGEGRETTTEFRVVNLDPKEEVLPTDGPLLLEAYNDLEKHDAFFSGAPGVARLHRLYGDGRHRLEVVAKAEDTDRLLITSERYDVFPDLWITNTVFETPRRISSANPQIADYAWGSSELVEWSSMDGTPLQGVLIKPGNYQPGTRYPVLVYYYRFSSQRLNQFNEPVVNHRPSFPIYASNGYAVFLPDIRFEVGRPGFSATKCLVPGVQKLVDMGVADPEAIGLHGHSWSGYQTAFVITQTDIFAAAAAGAPVSNMTSAYSGIRWGTGLARQFQYEKSQSRIGGSLWDYPERYIENSPVFFADRINTPLLIEFGDEDEAVPWYQGIELYLACRRLDKNCIMLQYRGEPHHLKKYANKLDYSIKMKEFFDHWLKGEPAPAWMSEGIPYRGK